MDYTEEVGSSSPGRTRGDGGAGLTVEVGNGVTFNYSVPHYMLSTMSMEERRAVQAEQRKQVPRYMNPASPYYGKPELDAADAAAAADLAEAEARVRAEEERVAAERSREIAAEEARARRRRRRLDAENTIGWERAISALIKNRSVKSAADDSGISERTLRRWMENPDFMRLYQNAQGDVISATIDALRSIREKAFSRLERAVESENEQVAMRAIALVYRISP